MKKALALIMLGVASLTMVACSSSTGETEVSTGSEGATESAEVEIPEEAVEPETVMITVDNGDGEKVEIEVPVEPERIVVLDYVALDQVISWGYADRIVGGAIDGAPQYLQDQLEGYDIPNVGGLKEVNMEQIMELEPDIIFTSGRLRAEYDSFTVIAPTVMTALDYEMGTVDSFEEFTRRNASIFGLDSEVDAAIEEYNERVADLREKAEGKTAVLGLMTGGSLNTLGNESRGAIIVNEIGFENLANDIDSTHGNVSSFELLVDLDPDFIFIIDRDSAISAEGASAAPQIMDNELVHQTSAYQNDQIIYLEADVWYTAEGGFQGMDLMLQDIEAAFE